MGIMADNVLNVPLMVKMIDATNRSMLELEHIFVKFCRKVLSFGW